MCHYVVYVNGWLSRCTWCEMQVWTVGSGQGRRVIVVMMDMAFLRTQKPVWPIHLQTQSFSAWLAVKVGTAWRNDNERTFVINYVAISSDLRCLPSIARQSVRDKLALLFSHHDSPISPLWRLCGHLRSEWSQLSRFDDVRQRRKCNVYWIYVHKVSYQTIYIISISMLFIINVYEDRIMERSIREFK